MFYNRSVSRQLLRFLFLIFLFPVVNSYARSPTYADNSDSAKEFVIRKITFIGNKRTKDKILYRELIFHVGDTLDESHLEKVLQKSKENLLNTLLLNTVDIQKLEDAKPVMLQQNDTLVQGLDIYIFVAERWYIFPAPIFELIDRNFNEWLLTKSFARANYGAYLYWNNFRGRNETVTFSARLGYTQQIGISYNIPYISHNQKDGLGASFSYNHVHEVGYEAHGDTLQYFNEEDVYLKNELYASISYFHREAIYDTYYFFLEQHGIRVNDTIIKLNPDYLAGGNTFEKYTTFRFFYKHDERNNVNYPLTGNYFDMEAGKNGFAFLRDDIGFEYVSSQYKKYWKLPDKFYFASSIKGKYSSPDFQPYYNTRALGYGSDYLRGYEYYVIDGQKYVLIKTDLKYELLPVHYFKTDIIPSEKFSTIPYAFYINLYADYGYVQDNEYFANNPLTNSNLYSYGAGIDFTTYYNFVIRAEYSINKIGQKGIFIHFAAPI